MNRLPTKAAQRCLFRNECLQAHLLGLNPSCPCFEAFHPGNATVIITYGRATAYFDGTEQPPLIQGQPTPVPSSSHLRLESTTEADVILMLHEG